MLWGPVSCGDQRSAKGALFLLSANGAARRAAVAKRFLKAIGVDSLV